MGKIKLSEQEIINGLCVYMAEKMNVEPTQVEIDLVFDDEKGFGAEAFIKGQMYPLQTFQMIEALRYWVEDQYGKDPFAARVHLELDDEEGILALVE